jgi:hypothetical protein
MPADRGAVAAADGPGVRALQGGQVLEQWMLALQLAQIASDRWAARMAAARVHAIVWRRLLGAPGEVVHSR